MLRATKGTADYHDGHDKVLICSCQILNATLFYSLLPNRRLLTAPF